MRRARFTSPLRFLLALVTLAASLCSAPSFGHSHGGLDADHWHPALLSDDHRRAHEHAEHDHEAEPTLSGSFHHFHGVFFGLLVTIPSAGSQVSPGGSFPFTEPHVASVSARDFSLVDRPEARPVWYDPVPALVSPLGDARILAFSSRTSPDSVRSAMALTPRSRGVVLRC
ncbi:hypothetical protein [Tautonia sociabilis]|uniref:DUF2946 domain-containing protein n=1 Tax=Tautonia sociabilis TaxID=2080755 RepID=A0A432MIB7_9BACT|nr:hypothetical protein [Tautonia sociabilis]RUL86977.1 hypothetical protein TsocGM_14365 [Tautonia sociabilis]